MTVGSPVALASAKLAASGITMTQAQRAGIRVLDAAGTKACYPGAPRAPSLRLDYLTPAGRPTGLYRLRLLAPPLGGFPTGQEQRYLQPPNTLPRVYVPRVDGVNWPETLSRHDHALVITEGELKALSATIQGVLTIGLGGVWNWRSAKNNIDLIDDLKAINWEGRFVYIAYDSDAVSKPDVAQATLSLARALGELGAVVHDAGLPDVVKDGKTGLDDFLVARGLRALEQHLSRAELIEAVQSLHEFNRRYLYVRSMDVVMDLDRNQMHEAGRFISRVAANEKYNISVPSKEEGAKPKMVSKPLAKSWMEWPRRAEVLRLDYVPGGDRVLRPGPRYNTWTGWGAAPKAGSVKPWLELLDYMFGDTETEAKRWFVRWCAYPLQFPGAKLFTAVAVWSIGTGVGKTLLGETLLRVYGRNGSLIGQGDLESSFNDWLDGKQFVLGDEVTGNDSRRHADLLKGLLTGTTVSVNRKFQPRYELPNLVNFYFTSNHPDAFFLEDNDRRFLVVEAPTQPKELEFYHRYDAWLRGPGPGALFHHLLSADVGDFHPRAPAPMTRAKQLMIEGNKSEAGEWVHRLRQDPDDVLPRVNGHAPREFFSNRELLAFYDPQGTKRLTANGLGRELKRAGFDYICDGQPVVADGFAQARYYAIYDQRKWRRATVGQAKKHLEAAKWGGKEKF